MSATRKNTANISKTPPMATHSALRPHQAVIFSRRMRRAEPAAS
ncbi:hypothetical protein [Streptomyces sp. WAC05950]|nr:hypothetical protein [Streptomyces sp. WAC05950]